MTEGRPRVVEALDEPNAQGGASPGVADAWRNDDVESLKVIRHTCSSDEDHMGPD